MAKHDHKGRSKGEGRYMRLLHFMLKTDAWRDLSANARAGYIEIASRYSGRNNGSISYSVREMAEALHVSKQTAMRLLAELQEHGFIVQTKKGAFSVKTERHASEWRLTEYPCDKTGALASKDFTRW
ncbi:MarR family transcriptional regulator [Roseibium aggregatum]|nr:helix-turn-helix domain-containing protein [Roseibium aggregatum]